MAETVVVEPLAGDGMVFEQLRDDHRAVLTGGDVAAWQANVASGRADAAKYAAEEASRSFEQLQYKDKQQFELYAKIEGLLKENSSGSLVLATTYVSLVSDPSAKGIWCAAVLNYARIRKDQLTPAESNAVFFAKECLSEAKEQLVEAKAVERQVEKTPEPSAAATAPSAVRWADKKVVSDGNAIGYDIDIFACETGGAASIAKAGQVAKRLADLSAAEGKIGHAYLGRVRQRWLTAEKQAEGGYPAGRDQIQPDVDDSEQAIAQALAPLAQEATGKPFAIGRSASKTDFYLSVFACGP